jgi:hypothetical protein
MNPIGEIDPERIAVVGAYTTPNGPFDDDYFLVVVTFDGEAADVPMGVATTETIPWLESTLGVSLEPALANRTDFASEVLFPKELKGEPLFTFEDEPTSLRTLLRSLRTFRLTRPVRQSFSEPVQRYLHQKRLNGS